MEGSPISKRVLEVKVRKEYLSVVSEVKVRKEYLSVKMNLDKYDGLTDPQEHIQNMRRSLELVIHDNDVICKILLTTFRGDVRIWYNNLKSGSILSFQDLYAKLVARFSTNIPMKKSSTELFGIIQCEKEFTRAYLRRFNEEMLQVEDLLEPITYEAWIKGARSEDLWKQLHPLQDRALLRVKQMIESHIRVKEALVAHRNSS